MKKLTLLMAALAAVSLTSCHDDPPQRVVHHSRTVHHYHRDSDQVNVPASRSDDGFEAVQKPGSYSQ